MRYNKIMEANKKIALTKALSCKGLSYYLTAMPVDLMTLRFMKILVEPAPTTTGRH